MRMMIKVFIFLMSVYLISTATIIPDPSNPLLMNKPGNNAIGYSIMINFKLPSNSIGLNYGQYIGVSFPKSIGYSDLFLDTLTAAATRFKCGLSDDITKYDINAVQSMDGTVNPQENWVAYCRLDDVINSPLKTGITYTLTITLTNIQLLSTNFIKSIGLFTSTSNTPEKLIIDNLPVFGSLGLYNNWISNATPPILDVSAVTVQIYKGGVAQPTGTTLYPYNTFDLVVTCKTNGYISADSYFIIKYPSDTVTAATAIVSNQNAANDALQVALKGDLGLQTFSSDSIMITGISEEIIPNRQFQLVLKNWTALDSNIGVSKNIEVWVYYKNTYSVLSYQFNSCFYVNPIIIAINYLNHPEGTDIYSQTAWPMKINFQSNADLDNGGYILIQQTNTIDNLNKWNFIASTCDFANNPSNISQSIGQRPVCSPVLNDFSYKGASSSVAYNGSGIIFKFNKINANVSYSVTVWGVAENCGSSSDPTNQSTSSQQFSFTLTVYKSYDPSQVGNLRLKLPVIASSTGTLISNRCWGSENVFDYANAKASATVVNPDSLYLMEVTDFKLVQSTTASTCTDAASCYSANINTGTPNNFYLNSYSISNPNFVLITGNFKVANNDALRKSFPFPLSLDADTYTPQPGRLLFQFSKGWLDNGEYSSNQECHVSWAFNGVNNSNIYQLTKGDYAAGDTANYISTSGANPTLDASIMVLPQSNPLGPIKIFSAFDSGSANFSMTTNNDATCTTDPSCNAVFGLYTNCLTWTRTTPKITSIHSYIDYQVIYQYMNSSTAAPVANRIVRFVKFVHSYDGFNNISNVYSGTNALYSFHYALGIDSSNDGVCILQINGGEMKKFIDTNTSQNYLLLFLYNLNLLDIDYTYTATNYPVLTNKQNTISAYGYNSALTINSANRYNADIDNSASLTSPHKINQTHFLFSLSSYLLIQNPSSFSSSYTTNNTDILLPTMCPFRKAAGSSQYVLPVITTALMTINSDNTIGKTFNLYKNNNYFSLKISNVKTVLSAGAINYSTLRFNRYSTTSDSNSLNIFPGTLNTTGGVTKCTAFTFLFTSKINVITPLTLNIGGSAISLYYYNNPTNSFSVYGKAFNQMAVAISSSSLQLDNTISANSNNEKSTYYLSGLVRPDITTFYNGKVFNTVDQVGFYCVSSNTSENSYMTNYLVDVYNTNNVRNFLLDFNPDNVTSWTMTKFNKDKTEDLYQDDLASNFQIQFTLPASIPTGAYITLTNKSGNFTPNTLCGIMNTNIAYASTCGQAISSSYTSYNCPVYIPSTTFTICCYNIQLTNSLVLDSLAVTFPIDQAIINLNSYISTNIYTAQTNILSWGTGNQEYVSISNLTTPSIKKINYIYTNQENGIGKLSLDISLPREITRDSRITISGDFKSLIIPSTIPRCVVTASNTSYSYGDIDNGDGIVESCTATNILNQTNSIIIKTKKLVYKCGLSFNKTLRVSIWPVIIVNWNISPMNKLTYTVNMTTNITGDYLIPKNNYKSMPAFQLQSNLIVAKPLLSGIWNSLCNVINVFPRLVEEVAYYDFEFDLYSNRVALADIAPNEFSIFFPFEYYGGEQNYKCLFLNNQLNKINCSNDEEGILTIKFSNSLTITETNPIIRIIGINNPSVESKLMFPCTVNYIDTNNIRNNLITGAGLLIGSITNPTTNISNLRIINNDYVLSDANPRSFGLISLKIAFDLANGWTIPASLTDSSYFIITFPAEYKFNFFTSLSITATIEEWINNENNVLTYNGNYSISSVSIFANSVVIYLLDATKIVPTTFRHWQIRLNNVPAPFDSINTGFLKITLSNNKNSILYKTFTNLNTMATTSISKPKDSFLIYNRGLDYNYDNTKYIIDIIDASDQSKINVITLTPGTYKQYIFRIRINSNLLSTGATNVTLSDNRFKLGQSSYTLLTSTGDAIFNIGCSCSTAKGYYYINFTVGNVRQFVLIPPIQVQVMEIKTSIIRVTYDKTVPVGSSHTIFYKILDLNFDQLSFSWVSDLANDSSASISSIVIAPQTSTGMATFQIINTSTKTSQIFTSLNPNKCFNLEANSITITPNNIYPDLSSYISNNTLLKDKFSYFDINTNSSLNIKMNTVRFSFTPPVSPLYLYCSIMCFDSPFPTDTTILNSSISPNFFNTYITNETRITFDFYNLMRSQTYKVKCIIQTTQTDMNVRQTASIVFNTINTTDNSTKQVSINTMNQKSTQCMRFTFSKDPGAIIKNSILNYCQTTFNNQAGCVKCMDNDGKTLQGISTKTYYTCNIDGDDKYYQQISANIPYGYVSIGGNINYTVCAVQDIFCDTDLAEYKYKISVYQMIQKLGSPMLFAQVLRVPPPPLSGLALYSDDYVPSLDNIQITDILFLNSGFYAFTLSNTEPLFCYWLISASSILNYTFDNLQNCNDISRCGIVKINNSDSTIVSEPEYLNIFLQGQYNIWIGCYNDIPNPQKMTDVKIIYSFTIYPPEPPAPSISGCRLKISYMILLFVLTFYFN